MKFIGSHLRVNWKLIWNWKPKLKGNLVRINKSKGVFDKGYLLNCTTEVFQIAAVKHTVPTTYEMSD